MVLDTPDPENDRRVAQHIVNIHKLRLKALQPPISSADLKLYICHAKTSFTVLTLVLQDRPVSQSVQNTFKTLPFIVDFMRHTHPHTHLSTCAHTAISRLVIMSGPSCRRSGNCSVEDHVPVSLPRSHRSIASVICLISQSSSRQLCLPRDGQDMTLALLTVLLTTSTSVLHPDQGLGCFFTQLTRELMDKTGTLAL